MGLLDWFRRKTTRYATIIALTAALASACRRDLPKDESASISAMAAQIQEALKQAALVPMETVRKLRILLE